MPVTPPDSSRKSLLPCWRAVALILSFLLAAPALRAQDATSSAPAVHDGWGPLPAPAALGLWVGGARGAEIKTRFGRAHDRDLLVVALRGVWQVAANERVAFEYTADVVPLLITTGNRFYESDDGVYCRRDCPVLLATVGPERRTAYAAGVQPVGVQWRVTISPRVSVAGGGSGGILWFSLPVPDEAERRRNWVVDAGGAARVRLGGGSALGVGYRFQHISNGGRGPVNPGIDTHVVYLSLERVR